ncbi:MAG: hypothetical protein FWB75_08950, partial [Oscillospiraceae bacterium]|nr:hypothetical protein [Oscillospiraceae bacterium]
MIRQKILTFLGISLAFAIAWGGWVFTSRFIIAQSDALLTETGSVLAFANLGPMPLPAPAPENESEDEEEPYQEMYFNL